MGRRGAKKGFSGKVTVYAVDCRGKRGEMAFVKRKRTRRHRWLEGRV